jgi:hypothetical protein
LRQYNELLRKTTLVLFIEQMIGKLVLPLLAVVPFFSLKVETCRLTGVYAHGYGYGTRTGEYAAHGADASQTVLIG